jgi:hypothetical protein
MQRNEDLVEIAVQVPTSQLEAKTGLEWTAEAYEVAPAKSQDTQSQRQEKRGRAGNDPPVCLPLGVSAIQPHKECQSEDRNRATKDEPGSNR